MNLWKQAWERRDYDAYFARYAAAFAPQKFADRQAWLLDRKEKLAAAGNLKISLNDVRIEQATDSAVVRFKQTYKTDRYSLKADKELHLQKVAGDWLIVQEIAN